MNKIVEYRLHAGDKQIPVGATRPRYDFTRKAWITDAGVFPAMQPGAYSVTAHQQTSAQEAASQPAASAS